MGKKYRSVYRSLSMTTNPKKKAKTTHIQVMSCSLPRLLPYNKLIMFLNEVDIGTLKSVRENFCSDLELEDRVDGCYRNLSEYLVRLATLNCNFLIFGINCSEQSTAVRRYIAMIAKEMEEIEKGLFRFGDTIIRFRFAEFPNDIKMLAYLGGELCCLVN